MLWRKLPVQGMSDKSCRGHFTHIPSADKHGDHVRFAQLGVSGPHQLEQLAEGVAFLKYTTAPWWAVGQEAADFRCQGSLHLPARSRRSSPTARCDCRPPPCALWQGCSGTWRSGGLKCDKWASLSLVRSLVKIVKARARKKKPCRRTSVVWDPLRTERPSFLVKVQHPGINIHRHCLSAGSHHLHLRTRRNAAVHMQWKRQTDLVWPWAWLAYLEWVNRQLSDAVLGIYTGRWRFRHRWIRLSCQVVVGHRVL